MAWSDFYIQTSGSNLNSGSSTDDAATLTYASGNWVNSTGVFTVASGNPSSDGITVGDWVSVYPDGSSVTPFVGQVTARDSTTITVSSTDKFGTKPSDGTGNRTLKRGGAWASFALTDSGNALNTGTVTVPVRINVKAATYAHTTSTKTFNLVGTNALPIWWRSYQTTPGDFDSDPTLTKTSFTFTTGGVTATAVFQTWTGFAFYASNRNGILFATNGMARFWRCSFENQNTGSASRGLQVNTSSCECLSCSFKCDGTSYLVTTNSVFQAVDCLFTGGTGTIDSAANLILVGCTFRNWVGGAVVPRTSQICIIDRCTFSGGSSSATAGIRFDTNAIAAGNIASITNCVFADINGYGINNNVGSVFACIRHNNLSYALTSGQETGFGDWPASGWVAAAGDPFTNGASGDFRLGSGSEAKASGTPAPWAYEGLSIQSYLDRGAFQREEPAGGGSGGGLKLAGSGGLAG